MRNISLLDCTLRDGGYLTDKKFHPNAIHNIIYNLTEANVEFIEIGFLHDTKNDNENVVYLNSKEARKFIPQDRKNTLYTAFADYSRYSISNLDEYDGLSFDCIRACFIKKERKDALLFGREIKAKGYKLFMQPVGVLQYSDRELLDLIEDINEIQPYCFSMVDTFGSMYLDDLRLIISLINHNLSPEIKIGFHSHNNMQLSNALSQEFLKLISTMRDGVVDSTLFGMGRGAGNTPTELIMQYANVHHSKNYDIDKILDVIDNSIMSISTYAQWGYDIPMYLSGAYGAHINNVNYLMKKASLCSKDIRSILSKLTDEGRGRCIYSELDELYIKTLNTNKDDTNSIVRLKEAVNGRPILIVSPGKTVQVESECINAFINENKPVVISINFIPEDVYVDYVYFNNPKRYDYFKNSNINKNVKTILTTNVIDNNNADYIVSIVDMVKNSTDNSTILLLKLADKLGVSEIALAGFDGFSKNSSNYANYDMEKPNDDPILQNRMIQDSLADFLKNKSTTKVYFITKSMFDQTEGLLQ